MERSFKTEVQSLSLGDGETFHGEGILAVTKALLQSGVSYVGGYQGAPVSHLLDVMVEAEPQMRELGVHVETCTNEASAAAMLGASINYPLRGAVTWKSIVGTNVAADALSNLASPGVIGGALIMLMYLVLGCLMDALAMIILTVPIVFPVIVALGFDPIWFGVIIVMTVELGLIHPPVGMNIFVIKSVVEDVKISTIFYGVLPFIITDILRLILLVAFPILAMWLPSHM